MAGTARRAATASAHTEPASLPTPGNIAPAAEGFDIESEIVVRLFPRELQWLEVDVDDRGAAKPRVVIDHVPDEE